MLILKLFLLLLTILAFCYFLLYIRQLRIIRKAVKEAVGVQLFFPIAVMLLLSGTLATLLFFSIFGDFWNRQF